MGKFLRVKNSHERFNLFDVIFFIIVCCITLWLFTTSKYMHSITGDTGDGAYAIFAGISRSLQQGELPLWYPYLWGGISGVGCIYTQLFYPITLLLCKFLFDPSAGYLSYNIIMWNQIIHVIILCLSLYTLLRIIKFRQFSCAIITIAGTFNFNSLRSIGWISLFNSTVWLPLLLAFSILFLREKSKKSWGYCAFAGLTLGMIGLANQAQSLLIIILIFIFLYLFYVYDYRNDKNQIKRITFQSLIFGMIGICISGVSLFPFIEFQFNATRFIPGAVAVNKLEKLNLESFLENSVPINELNGIFMGAGRYGWFSIGIFFAFLLLLSFFIKVKINKTVYYFAQFSLIFNLLYSIALIFPYILYYVPFYNAIREPFLYAPYIGIMASILAAYSLDKILSILIERDSKKVLSENFINLPCMLITLLVFIGLTLLPEHMNSLKFIVVACLIVFICLLAYRIYNRKKQIKLITIIAMVIILVGVYIDFYSFSRTFGSFKYTSEDADLKVSQVNESVKSILAKDPPSTANLYRICSWGDTSYPKNEAAVLGYYDALAYLNPIYTKVYNIHKELDLRKRAQLQNIKYFVYTDKADKNFVDWFNKKYNFKHAFTIDGVYRTYDDKEPSTVTICASELNLGHAWLVYDAILYSTNEVSDKNIIATLNDPNIDLSKTALVNASTLNNKNLNLHGVSNVSSVLITSHKSNTISMLVNSDKPSLLITSESSFPGWKSYVDGKRVPIIEVNYAFNGVFLDAGSHIVEFKYMPNSFIMGICTLTIAIAIIIFLILKYFVRSG